MNIKEDLMNADRKGLNPPQNWTTRAVDRIELLEKALQDIIELPSVRQDECCCIAF